MDPFSGGLGQDAEAAPARPVPGAGPCAVDRFRSLLLSISSGLSAEELASMKFLCNNIIGKGKSETVRVGLELFSLLMERRAIAPDDLGFLKTLLRDIRRGDLLALVEQFEQGELQASEDQPDEHEKRRWIIIYREGFYIVISPPIWLPSYRSKCVRNRLSGWNFPPPPLFFYLTFIFWDSKSMRWLL